MRSLLISTALTSAALGQSWDDICTLENIPLPKHIDPQVGGIGISPDGSIFAAMHRGEVLKFDGKQWHEWGQGLHEPLGLHIENDHSIIVVQRAELTRITDTDQDGTANTYKNLCSDWGMSGNYHEFSFGPAKAKDGSFFVSLGTASNNGGVRPEIRGEWNDAGKIPFDKAKATWKPANLKIMPRMYCRVPYRGWVLKINPETGEMTPYASGLRTPHGIHVTPKGDLYINDNQGDWLGSSKLYKIEQGKFYGHPDSLLWTKDWNRGTPADLPPAELDKLRSKSVAFLPQGDLANSPTQIITLPEKGFGPYNGSMIMGEMNQPRLVRYMPDTVNGKEQGAVISFLQHPDLGKGNSKLAVLPPSSLLIGKTHLSWAGDKGIRKATFSNKPHLAITAVKLTPKGFDITLNEAPGTNSDSEKINISGTRYGLHYFAKYGSPKVDPKPLSATSIKIEGKTIKVELATKPQPNQIYDITLENFQSPKHGPLLEPRFHYTAHEVPHT